MKKYLVHLNGEAYEVEIEEVDAGACEKSSEDKKVEEKNIDEEKQKEEIKSDGNGEYVTAPMPGKILRIESKEGESVKAGENILILEAMKMENEIMASRDCTILKLLVKEGDTVDTGEKLALVK